METKHLYTFGPFLLDPARRLLQRDGKPIPLPSKAFETLLLLVAHSDRLLEKDELMRVLWPDATVEENNLSQSISAIRKALNDSTQEQHYIETVPGWGYRFAARVQSISEEMRAILDPVSPPVLSQPRGWLDGRVAVLSMALILLLLAATAFYVASQARVRPANWSVARPRTAIAVLGFDNLSEGRRDEWLATALAEMLRTELATGDQLRLVSGEQIAQFRTELLSSQKNTATFTTASHKGLDQTLGSDLLIFGSYVAIQDEFKKQIRVDIRLENARTGEMVAEIAETGAASDLFDLVSRAGARMRQKLGVSGLSPSETVLARASIPASAEAQQYYSEGLANLRVFDAVRARNQLLQSINFDGNYPLSHSALADAWSALGYDNKAADEGKKAFQLSNNLPLEGKLVVEGRYREGTREWAKAVDVYNRLTNMFPDNPEYGLRLAAAQIAGARARDALVTLDRLRSLAPPLGQDPRISLESSDAWHALGDFKQMESSLEEATRNALTGKHPLLLARGRSQQCFAWRFLGQRQKAIEACQEAQRIYESAGDRAGQAESLRLQGDALSESDVSAAMTFYQQALAIHKDIGHLWGESTVLNQIAILNSNRGDHKAAKDSFEKVLRISRLLDNKVAANGMMLNIASELGAQGDLPKARSMFEATFRTAGELGNKEIQGIVANNIALIDQLRGDLEPAQTGFQQAHSLLESVQDKDQLTVSINGMGEVAMYKGEFDEARKLYESALAGRRSAQQKIPAAETQLNLAALSVERGDSTSKVEATVRELVDLFRQENAINDETAATSLLARILLAEGRQTEALGIAEKALSVSAKADPSARLAARVTTTPILVATGRSTIDQATSNLNLAIVEARKLGYSGTALEAMLILGELQIRSGAVRRGQMQLQLVRKEASRRGFNVLARKAIPS